MLVNFVPPIPVGVDPGRLERLLARVPGMRRFGYFYLMRGRRAAEGNGEERP